MEDDIVAQLEPFAPSFSRLMDLKCEVKADEQPSAASASFEVAWSMKIQQFDDSESDEEVLVRERWLCFMYCYVLSCNICRSRIRGTRIPPTFLLLTSRGIASGTGRVVLLHDGG